MSGNCAFSPLIKEKTYEWGGGRSLKVARGADDILPFGTALGANPRFRRFGSSWGCWFSVKATCDTKVNAPCLIALPRGSADA